MSLWIWQSFWKALLGKKCAAVIQPDGDKGVFLSHQMGGGRDGGKGRLAQTLDVVVEHQVKVQSCNCRGEQNVLSGGDRAFM